VYMEHTGSIGIVVAWMLKYVVVVGSYGIVVVVVLTGLSVSRKLVLMDFFLLKQNTSIYLCTTWNRCVHPEKTKLQMYFECQLLLCLIPRLFWIMLHNEIVTT
ncbi:MAG: hypothetical protein MUD14_20150, partial [Hydrococcus sp. Prado102]|nr:hypothetical protein [Hydrococcus sp. Prado102]